MATEHHNRIICALEVALKDAACNELPVWQIVERIQGLRCCEAIPCKDILEVLQLLVDEGLYDAFGVEPNDEMREDALIARSPYHPSVSSCGDDSGGDLICL